MPFAHAFCSLDHWTPLLASMAEQVLRDVRGRSRFARRHAAVMAETVLGAIADQRAGEPAPSLLVAMAGLAECAVADPEAVASLVAFAGAA